MVFDLDVVVEKKRYIKYNEKDVEILPLDVETYLLAEYEANAIQEIEENPDLKPREMVKALADQQVKYLTMVLDISDEDARQMNYRQFRALRQYLTRLDLEDQGFTPKEIDRMEKMAAKNRMEQLIDGSQ